MQGMKWNHLLRPESAEFLAQAITLGELYLLSSGIPALVESENIDNIVHGELWNLTDPFLIRRLYNFEQEAGYYRKNRKITTVEDWNIHPAYMYLYPKEQLGDGAIRIADGDYYSSLREPK